MPYKVIDYDPGDCGSAPETAFEKPNTTIIDKSKKHVIFLVRKPPESIGGVQRHSARLSDGLAKSYFVEMFNWKGPEWGAPFSFPMFYHKSVRNGAHLVHCDDAVTSFVGAKISNHSNKKVVATVHGLDIILPLPWYQKRLPAALQSIDHVVCVSRATAKQVIKRGVNPERIRIIPNAAEEVDFHIEKNEELYQKIESQTGADLRGKKVLFSLGRPLKRKGFDQFIENVFPHLPEDYVYIAAGPKPKTPKWLGVSKNIIGRDLHHILSLASGCYTVHDRLVELSGHPRVYYFNGVSEELRNQLYAVSDLFILPNRTIDGDMEGFGIVALEAAVRGVPVIATGIEGITDAVIDGENGYCIPEGDIKKMAGTIKSLIDNPDTLSELGKRARKYTASAFSIASIVKRYNELFEELLRNGNGNGH
ncbi:MAG: glycosyltransferase [candidate division Zixibacteria bacterium]|nr:glycosyltransferase [candidate division Zixibacteria bacterium]